MVKVVGVKFKELGKAYYFAPGELELKLGDEVIVETSRGLEYGTVSITVREVEESEIVSPLKEVVRVATNSDKEQVKKNKKKEKEAFSICEEKIAAHKLDMKLVDVEYTFDANKILFYFTADGRVDFRELVKDLASVFRTRIELRQIGIRDEAKMLGGIGICGRGLCCSTYLDGFHPVSIKMAKEQGLSLNPTKISGNCGRLMCCLKYEQNCYDEFSKIAPSVGAVVSTPHGKGIVQSSTILKGVAKVKLDGEGEARVEEFNFTDLKILKNNQRQNDNSEDLKELKKLEEN
ncbi:MAG: stage 0 sporulation family protein [Clostridia bacterium]|nr:stage 0 sporulation family protein [Clostridia bacterium]